MSDRVPATRAALPVETKPRGGLPNLDRYLDAERLAKSHSEAISKTSMGWLYIDSVRFTPNDVERARRELAQCPEPADLRAVAHGIRAAMAEQPDRRVVQTSLAVLFDSRARGPQNPEIYLQALTYDLVDEGFPPAVVVAACQTLRREQVFTPEIAEVIAACRKKAATYTGLASLAARLVKTRESVEAAIIEAERPRIEPKRKESLDWDGG